MVVNKVNIKKDIKMRTIYWTKWVKSNKIGILKYMDKLKKLEIIQYQYQYNYNQENQNL